MSDPSANSYYEYNRNILPGGLARSEPLVEQFNALQQAFAFLPAPIRDTEGTRGFSEPFPVPDATSDAHPATYGQATDATLPIARLPKRRTEGEPGFDEPVPMPDAVQDDHAVNYRQATDDALPIARLPQRRNSGPNGFAAPLPVGLGTQYDHAATVGQLQKQKEVMQAAEARAVNSATQASVSQQDAQNSYAASQAIYSNVASAQAQTNALLGLGIGSTYVNGDGDLVMTYDDSTVNDVSISADGYLTINY